jgi:sarcosine oxidase gamma subunit
VLAQTCGIDFEQAPPRQVILTRLAGVTCAILPQPEQDTEVYRLWVDHSHGIYLWQTLVQISDELGGRVIGAACFYPHLQVS